MEDLERKKIRKFIYLAILGVLVIIGISVYFIIRNIQMNATLDLLVTPLSAKIEINGRIYKNGEHKFDPGEINVEITKEGFKTQNYVINLPANETTKLYTYLVQNDGSLNWYLDHQEDEAILMQIGGIEATEESEKYTEQNPVVAAIPIIVEEYKNGIYYDFRVDGGMFENCKKDFCLKISDVGGNGYERALEEIRKRGYNPENYEILYELVSPSYRR